MKEFKGTKGEWGFKTPIDYSGNSIDTLYSRWIMSDDKVYICSVQGKVVNNDDHVKSVDEMIANAKLIAAAPDLLEALQEILESVDNSVWNHQSLEKGTKAIEKALN